ncbi:helix-turn-helix domain-containing protein [Oceanobacillus halophilus]|uniref:Helix-turn-helix domain-containing protein n=1 Tax=Oceanobacillus halophilus TaxID=930130 RepID=A0A494ZV23_9BACI|nr:tetratricopeptide repeat protein [Oceanobacillus halophilus]RKQ30239.1 helix-turn-helix domain-containing protein [Oceanobacillus halophilus]
MHAELGNLIKLERIKQNMKQITLAKGICSTSYLSKIENGTAKASEEVIHLLLNKLNIELPTQTKLDKETEEEFVDKIMNIYKEVTTNRDNNYIKESLDYLINLNASSFSKSTFYSLNLVILRLQLVLKDSELIQSYIEYLETESANFTKLQLYLFHKIKGIYHYQNQDIKNSIESFLHALNIRKDIVIPDWDEADLNYMLGLSYMVDVNIVKAIEVTKKSLEYFKDSFLINRSIDCYLVLGIAYKNGHLFQEALETFELALEIVEKFHLCNYKGKILQNIGSLYSTQDSNKAISYYKQSFELKKDPSEKMISILSIIMEYHKLNEYDLAREWVDKGIEMINNDDIREDLKQHLFIYQPLILNNHINEDTLSHAIDFFESIKDHKNCYKYSIMLADSFFNNGKYKSASIHYQKANSYMLKTLNVKTKEEI